MPFEPEVLDKRVVASDDLGNEMAWYLETLEDGESEWVPRATHANGKIDRPVWMPFPGSQYTFLECPVYETLYHGTRGNGKTLVLVMDFAKEVGKGYGKAWRGILFRQKLGDLDGFFTASLGANLKYVVIQKIGAVFAFVAADLGLMHFT